jgi:hypothetical protein
LSSLFNFPVLSSRLKASLRFPSTSSMRQLGLRTTYEHQPMWARSGSLKRRALIGVDRERFSNALRSASADRDEPTAVAVGGGGTRA